MSARRVDAIDWLRGLIMVLMALDHTRDFFMGFAPDPTDLATTNPALFATRWITHLCAPGFLLLAGLSVWLRANDAPRGGMTRYLIQRGVMLIVLELTLVSFLWIPVPRHDLILLQVIWAIGWSMLILAPLRLLPVRAVGLVGIALMALHPLLADLWPQGPLRVLALTAGETLDLDGIAFIVSYPVLPWAGVMAAGYALGPFVAEPRWRGPVFALGLAITLGFVVFRAANLPGGDPAPWTPGRDALWSAMGFLNTDKYPPSPLYLAMTLGPLLMLLAAMETARDRPPLRWLGTFGRAPLFFYVAHLALLRAAGLAAAALVWGPAALGPPPAPSTPQWPLWAVWLICAVALAALYPPTRWYAGMRARRRDRASSAP